MPIKLTHDAVSWVLAATAPSRGLGVPYLDYWDIKPPGLLLTTGFWIRLFGDGYWSLMFLHGSLLIMTALLMARVWSKLFPRAVTLWLTVLGSMIFLSPFIQTQFLASELFGLCAALVGLNFLLCDEWSAARRAKWAAFFLILSGQMKDSFGLAWLALIPLLYEVFIADREGFRRILRAVLLGAAAAVGIVGAYLLSLGAATVYIDVLLAKRALFPLGGWRGLIERLIQGLETPRRSLFHFSSQICPLLAGFGLAAALRRRTFLRATGQNTFRWSAFMWAIGLAAGYGLQGKYGAHYDIQIVFPLLVFLSLITWWARSAVNGFPRLLKMLFVLGLLFLTLPRLTILLSYRGLLKTPPPPNFSLEERIQAVTEPGDCILDVYGWGAGATYYYSQRKPCTRFFLPNILLPAQKTEYVESLIVHPPAAVVYRPAGADMNVPEFENNTFQHGRVLEHCYEADTVKRELFLPRQDINLSGCIKKYH